MIDEWENTYSPKAIGQAYRYYLAEIARSEYRKGNLGERYSFRSHAGNLYDTEYFISYWKTKDLEEELTTYGINYMSKAEFTKTL